MAEAIRFYTDEHVALAVVTALRRRGVDVVRAQEAGLRTATDEAHLAYAAAEGRVLVTLDADFLRLHAAGTHHAGIAYAPQPTEVGYLVRALLLMVDVLQPAEMIDHVEYL